MRLMSDNPILTESQDQWGLRRVAVEVCQSLAEMDDPPITVGIFGSWGSGKTSLLRLVEGLARDDKRYHSVWFNAWKYEKREEVWPALIQAILTNLAANAPSKAVRRKIMVLAQAATQIFAERSLQFLTHGIVSAEDVGHVIARIRDIQRADHPLCAGRWYAMRQCRWPDTLIV